MKTKSPRQQRATASRSASSSPHPDPLHDVSFTPKADAPTTPPPTPVPAPEPPKPVSIRRQFLKDVAAIFAGRVSDPGELYAPCTLMDMDTDKVVRVGVVTDPMTRELFSLGLRLSEQAQCLPIPRNAEQVEELRDRKKILKGLSSSASFLGWTCIKDQFPKDANRASMTILDGWVVVRKPDLEDRLRREAQMIGCFGSSEIEAHVAKGLREAEAKKQEVTFEEIEGTSGGEGGADASLEEFKRRILARFS
ncbi:MAG: hypothetical protein NT077_00090 [Candidatus Taylorbacteria bacterium]|nr:hypothetical protein [Candidatus Taylorbacteria bacterium]